MVFYSASIALRQFFLKIQRAVALLFFDLPRQVPMFRHGHLYTAIRQHPHHVVGHMTSADRHALGSSERESLVNGYHPRLVEPGIHHQARSEATGVQGERRGRHQYGTGHVEQFEHELRRGYNSQSTKR